MELTASANLPGNGYPDVSLPFVPAAPSGRSGEPVPPGFRIAFVVTRSDSFGGSSVHIRDLARVLMQAGHEVMVFIGGEGPVTEAYREAGVPYVALRHLIRKISPLTDLRGIRELRGALRKFKPDLVSTHTSKAGFLGRLAAWSLGIPAVYTPHCWSFTDGFPGARLYLWAERLARPFGRRIIMVSEAERCEGIKGRVGSPRHLVTVHNGMPDVPERFRANPELSPVRLMMVGRFEKQKDHLTLFRALAQLKDLPWTLDNIGDGPLRPQVEAAVQELGLGGRINLHGYQRDVVERMSQSQIFVLISNWEGFSRSIIEAMRAGLPVIASAVGGNAEAVEDGRTGFIVQRADIGGLAQRLRTLIGDPELRGKFGAAGRRRYEENFTFDQMVGKTIEVWEAVVGRSISIQPRLPAGAPVYALRAA